MAKLFSLLLISLAATAVVADIYMHNPRGSNNRNCLNDANRQDRRNGNRLFDSQNNDKGGYPCPRAFPFSAENQGERAIVDAYGNLDSTTGNHIDTETFFYYSGSKLNVEWTNQHGCGSNDNLNCRVVIQYMCNNDLDENADDLLRSLITNEYLRDGTPVIVDGDNLDDEATNTIPDDVNNAQCNPDCIRDGRYGYMESHAWYDWCKQRERNKGLFTADQLPVNNNNRNRAINTRQNPNGQRRGLECPEERDYYPYWTPTMWRDIAVGVPESELETCRQYVQESQNVKDKNYCDMTGKETNNAYPNNEAACTLAQGVWKSGGNWGLDAPECFALPWMRDNHLGNSAEGYPMHYNWTIPNVPQGLDSMRCTLRVRYNTTTKDFPEDLDYLSNCDPDDDECTNSPIYDRNNREAKTYVHYLDESEDKDDRMVLSLAVNTNQYARTFQDRSYVFDIKPVPESMSDMCKKNIYNLNVRGKRGNIVQVYPSVEYDFVPQDLAVEEEDCLHIQWIGSDYNNNRNPNNGEGGPTPPHRPNEARADRTNLLQFNNMGGNHGNHIGEWSTGKDSSMKPFFVDEDGNPDKEMMMKFAFLDQDLSDCFTFEQLLAENPNNRNDRERSSHNCAKLNTAQTPYFKGAVVRARQQGSHKFFSTRNNNFSNRSQKLKIDVGECTENCDNSGGLSDGQIAGIVIGVLASVGVLGFAAYTIAVKKAYSMSSLKNAMARPTAPAKPAV